jgi:hypothetical protein
MSLDNNFMNINNRKYLLKYKVRFIGGILLFSILASVMFLSSCDPGSTLSYSIVNKTDSPLKVKYQFVFTTSKDTSIKEIIVLANSSKLLNSERVLGYVDRVVKERDSIYLYKLILINGNNIIRRNFKDKKYWTLIKTNEQMGTYSLIIDSGFLR